MKKTNVWAVCLGFQTDDPGNFPPVDAFPAPLSVDQNGVLWTRLAAGGSGGGVAIPGLPDNTDSTTPTATANRIPTVARMYGYDSGNGFFRRVGSRSTNFNVISPSASEYALTAWTIPVNFDGSFFRRNFSASAANLALQSGEGVQLATGPGEWAIEHTPAANTQATISRAAVASQRHVCKGFTVTLSAVAAIAAPLVVVLRDGASGAGTILWSSKLMAPAGQVVTISRDNLNIVGSVNTAMTLEFAAAPGATNFENVALNGYTAA